MFTDMSAAGASDALEDAVDYADISRRVITEVEGASFQLLEALGAHLLTIIVNELGVTGVKLTIHKPAAVPEARTVGIQMQRGETF